MNPALRTRLTLIAGELDAELEKIVTLIEHTELDSVEVDLLETYLANLRRQVSNLRATASENWP